VLRKCFPALSQLVASGACPDATPPIKRWRGVHHWKEALQTFQILFGEERVPLTD